MQFSSVQFSSVTQSCPILCDPMNCSTPLLPVHHQLPEFTQTHLHQVGDAIQPSHPLPSPSPPAPNPSQLETPKTEPHRENYTQASRRKTCYIEMNFLQYFEETFNLFRSWPSNPILHSVNTICCCCLVTKSCPTLCNPMNCNTPGLLVHHQLPEFTQTHFHQVGDAIQPSHPL